MNLNAQASRLQVATMLVHFLENVKRFELSPAKAALAVDAAIAASLSSGEGSLTGARALVGLFSSGGNALAGDAHSVGSPPPV